MTAKESENMNRLFKLLDDNHDGYLSIEELERYLTINKNSLNPETIIQLKNLSMFIESEGINGKVNYT